MQVTKTEAPDFFKPIDLTIRIETKEDLNLLKEIFGCDFYIPDLLIKNDFIGENQRSQLSAFFANAYQELIK